MSYRPDNLQMIKNKYSSDSLVALLQDDDLYLVDNLVLYTCYKLPAILFENISKLLRFKDKDIMRIKRNFF